MFKSLEDNAPKEYRKTVDLYNMLMVELTKEKKNLEIAYVIFGLIQYLISNVHDNLISEDWDEFKSLLENFIAQCDAQRNEKH